MSDGVESQNLRRVMRRNMNPENYDPPTFDEVMREKEDTITALRAALDQERANNERLRAFAQWALDRIPDAVCDEMHKHGLIDINGDTTALLSGRGEGGNDG